MPCLGTFGGDRLPFLLGISEPRLENQVPFMGLSQQSIHVCQSVIPLDVLRVCDLIDLIQCRIPSLHVGQLLGHLLDEGGGARLDDVDFPL